MVRIRFSVLPLLMMPSAAFAVPDGDMIRCSAIAADAERLACYDDLAGSLGVEAAAAAAARRAAAVEAAKQAETAAKERMASEFGGEQTGAASNADDKLDALAGKVTESFVDAYGKYLLVLDNGQLWKQLDGKLLTVRQGDAVTIERAALGSYRLKIERQKRVVRARRIK